jgi:hypothetical protein
MHITTIMSGIALVISAFAFFVASEKLRLDLYNKRFEVYQRTVKFYMAMFAEDKDPEALALLRRDFIIASREAQFLFSPKSGVYGLLVKLLKESTKITDRPKRPEGLVGQAAVDFAIEQSTGASSWNYGMEHLEVLIAPYLNYHRRPWSVWLWSVFQNPSTPRPARSDA